MPQQFTGTVSLTSDATTIAAGFRPTYLRVDPSTANTAFISFSTIIATTASTIGYPLTSGGTPLIFTMPVPAINGMSSQFTAVTSAGGTTVIRVLAVRL